MIASSAAERELQALTVRAYHAPLPPLSLKSFVDSSSAGQLTTVWVAHVEVGGVRYESGLRYHPYVAREVACQIALMQHFGQPPCQPPLPPAPPPPVSAAGSRASAAGSRVNGTGS